MPILSWEETEKLLCPKRCRRRKGIRHRENFESKGKRYQEEMVGKVAMDWRLCAIGFC